MTDETPLPGMEADPVRADGPVTAAARRTIAALGPVLDESHAVMCAALVTTAQQLDRAAASSRAKDYGVANLVAQLRETWHALIPDAVDGGGDDAWDDLAADLRRAAALRDPA
jgi:hypothetical protein